MGLSVIVPVDVGRLPLLKKSIDKYLEFGIPYNVEFLYITRTLKEEDLAEYKDKFDFRIISYEIPNSNCFSQSKALNIGILNAKYSSIVTTSPEVRPITNTLRALLILEGKNVVTQVYDLNEDGSVNFSLVHTGFRSETPSMHFFAMFNKDQLIKINGWDEDYNRSFDDDDFGFRFSAAGFPWEMHDEILSEHQWHFRPNWSDADSQDHLRYDTRRRERILKPKNGIYKLKEDSKEV